MDGTPRDGLRGTGLKLVGLARNLPGPRIGRTLAAPLPRIGGRGGTGAAPRPVRRAPRPTCSPVQEEFP